MSHDKRVKSQAEWQTICKDIGESAAKKELARQLRLAADLVDSDDFPDVYGAEMLPIGSDGLNDFIATISVTLTYPWPG